MKFIWYLKNNNVKNSRKGYIYLASAIELGLNQLQDIYYIMKIYEEVAKKIRYQCKQRCKSHQGCYQTIGSDLQRIYYICRV